MTKCLDETGTLNYSAVVGGCKMFPVFLNLIHTSRSFFIEMRMGKIKEGYLKMIIDASNLLKLTSPVITAVGLVGFQDVISPFPSNRPEVSTRRK